METPEPNSSIREHSYSYTTDGKLTGWMEIFKGGQKHTHTLLEQCIMSSVKPGCLCVLLSVHMCEFPLLGPAVDSADLLGKREKEKGRGKAN